MAVGAVVGTIMVVGGRTRGWSRTRAWPTGGRDSHSSLLQLPLLLQLSVSLWVSVPVWVRSSDARLWFWLRPLLDQISGTPFLLSRESM